MLRLLLIFKFFILCLLYKSNIYFIKFENNKSKIILEYILVNNKSSKKTNLFKLIFN